VLPRRSPTSPPAAHAISGLHADGRTEHCREHTNPSPVATRLIHEAGGGLRGIGLLDTAREVDHGQAQASAEQNELGGRFEPEVGNPAAVLDGFLESGIRWRRQHQTPIVG